MAVVEFEPMPPKERSFKLSASDHTATEQCLEKEQKQYKLF